MKQPTHYQKQAVRESRDAFAAGEDFLLVSPMGSGKTAMIGLIAQAELDRLQRELGRPARAYVLTHRKRLFKQIAGDPAAENAEDRRGDVAAWTGERVGTIAEPALGGVDTDPRIVAAMVQTMAARLEKDPRSFPDADVVFIDECHHMSDRDEDEAATSYARVVAAMAERNPDLRICGATATDWRSRAEESLDARLEEARRFQVTYEQAIAAKRIVLPRTVRLDMVHENGETVARMAQRLAALGGHDRVAAELGAEIGRHRPKDYWDRVVEQWARHAGGRKTMVFCDSVDEMEQAAGAFERLRERRPDAVSGVGMVASRFGADDNDAAFEAYGKPGAAGMNVLISCKMIGEGFNVPDTDVVVIGNRCTTRGWYAQMIGRAMRQLRDGSKKEALVLDGGGTTFVWGALERQIEMQSFEVGLDRAQDEVSRAFVLARTWHMPDRDESASASRWLVFPSERTTYFAHEDELGGLRVFHLVEGKARANAKQGAVKRIERLDAPEGPGGERRWTREGLVALTRDEFAVRFGWQAIMRTEATENPRWANAWEEHADRQFRAYREVLELFVGPRPVAQAKPEAGGSPAERAEKVRKAARAALDGNAETGTRLLRYLDDVLDRNQGPVGRRETLRLVAVSLRAFAQPRCSVVPPDLKRACQAASSVVLEDHRADLKRVPEARLGEMLAAAAQVSGQAADRLAMLDRPSAAALARGLSDLAGRAAEASRSAAAVGNDVRVA